MFSTIFLTLVFLIMLLHFYSRYCRAGRLYDKISGPKAYPIFGNMLEFFNKDMDELWTQIRAQTKKYYPITRTWGIDRAFVHVFHPDDLEILLSSPKAKQKGYVYWFLAPWLKEGLLTSGGYKWKRRRKILTPAFHFGVLKKYMEIISEHGMKMIDSLKNEGDETVKSLIPFCSFWTLSIICEATMGTCLNRMDASKVSEYTKAIYDMGQVLMFRMVHPYIPECLLCFSPRIDRLHRKSLKVLHKFTAEIIRQRKEYHDSTDNRYLIDYANNTNKNVYEVTDIGRKKRLAMLDLLLAAEQQGLIDREGVQEEVDTFTFEGHDTSAMALVYVLLLLAENKEAQDLARAEVTRVVDSSDGNIGMAEVQEFNYLERCIKESLRIYPPVSTILRRTPVDIQLKHALVPATTHIMIHFWDTHHDPEFWPDPEKFDPDRFLPENSKNRHPFAYVPFSGGPRNCIGQKFAMMELKLLIARILYNFYLEPVDRLADMKLNADIILRPSKPVHVKFVRINKR